MEIYEKVVKILEEICGNEDIEPSDNLQNDLALDSLDLVTFLVSLEDEFEIEFDESDMNPYDFETVENVIKIIEKYLGDDYEKIC